MQRTVRTLAVLVAVVSAVGLGPADAAPADERLTPRVTVPTPWAKDDPGGDADRPQGDLRRVTVENGRQQIRLTFRMAANPIWDTPSTSRYTRMAFKIDWQGTPLAFDRRVVVSRADGAWRQVIFDGNGNGICLRDGGVRILPNYGFGIRVPVTTGCMGGAKVIRVAGEFLDDHDNSAGEDVRIDRVPNGGGYGPFIRLPN